METEIKNIIVIIIILNKTFSCTNLRFRIHVKTSAEGKYLVSNLKNIIEFEKIQSNMPTFAI